MVNDANTGGAQTLIESLAAQALGKDDVHVFVLMTKGSLSLRLESVATSVSYGGLSRNSKNFIRPVLALRRLIQSLEVDVVHSHLLQSDFVCLIASPKTPVLSTLHTSGAHESNLPARIVSKLVASCSRRFSAVVACSQTAMDYAHRMHYFDSGKMQVICNGSSIPPFEEETSRNPVLLCLSRWHPMKDHGNLLTAFERFVTRRPEWTLVLAGDGMDEHNRDLAELISSRGLDASVRVLGPVSDVGSLLREAAALVISSSHGEALPMAGIEALAQGLPVLSTNVGDCASLVVHSDFLVSPRSSQQLAAAMERIASLSDPEYADLMRKSWDVANTSFNSVHTEEAYRKLYEKLVSTQMS